MKNPFDVYTSLNSGKKNKPLEWEESAPNSQGTVEGFFDEERTAPSLHWLWVTLVVCFLVIIGKIFFLQMISGATFRALSEENRIRKQTILAPRGIVKDRNGIIIVENTASFNLVAVPFDLRKEGLQEEVQKLADTFQLDIADVQKKLENFNPRSFQSILIKQDMTADQSILFETKAAGFAGFSIQKIPIRQYPDSLVFSHVLGYAGIVSPADLGKSLPGLYDANDYIGKSGIELEYEKYLHGTNGENQVEVDATGKLINVLGENPPTPGDVVVLNIDSGLQKKLYDSFPPGTKGAAVAINPKTGEVLALASVPGFNNNLFAHGISKIDYQALLDNKLLPLFNRSIAGTYPPGSTVKPMVAAAALQEHIVNENTVVVDHGVLVIPNQYNPALSYNFYGWKRGGLGAMNVRSAIAESSDIYFYTVSGGYPNSSIKGLGAEKLADYYRTFNLGNLTGIDIQGEKSGIVADPVWKAEYFKSNSILSKWYLGDTYHIGIGQGDMLVTPLQVALWTATIANNGIGLRPHIVNRVIDNQGAVITEQKPEAFIRVPVSPGNMKIVQEGMRQTIVSGSGSSLRTLPITSAGKTGTSQFDGSDPTRTHAWFTAYAPYEDPQIVITVLVEAGGEGHLAALPIVKDALKWWADNRMKK